MSHGSHSNYLNVHSSHSSHASSTAAHTNHSNHASTGSHTNHSNHSSTADPNTGLPVTLSWTNWASSPTSGGKVKDSSSAIKELRDKLTWLQANKGQYTTLNASNIYVPNNPAIDMTNVADSTFSAGVEIVAVQYDTILTGLDTLNNKIAGATSGLSSKAVGDLVHEEDIINLKTKIDSLANLDVSSQHASHHNSGAHSSHANHSSTGTVVSHVNHSSHSSHGSYSNAHSSHSNYSDGPGCAGGDM